MTYIKLFIDYLDAIEPLGDAERGRLFTALLEYAKTGEAPQLGGNERFLFPMMRAQIDRDNVAFEDTASARSVAGKKGAQAKASKAKQNKQMPDLLSKTSKDKGKDKDEDNDKDVFPPTPRHSEQEPAQRGNTRAPTWEQVHEYAKLRGHPEFAKQFFDYYDAANWRNSQNAPVYNWQQKFIAWEMNELKHGGGGSLASSAGKRAPDPEAVKKDMDRMEKYLRKIKETSDDEEGSA